LEVGQYIGDYKILEIKKQDTYKCQCICGKIFDTKSKFKKLPQCKHLFKKTPQKKKYAKIIIGKYVFCSIPDAVKKLKLSYDTIEQRLYSDNYPFYQFID